MVNILVQESSKKFCCKKCNYYTSRKSQYDRHLLTLKHEKITNDNNLEQKVPNEFICECGKKYNYLSGLSRHRKTCKGEKKETAIIENEENKIIDILTDSKARQIISNNQSEIKRAANDFIGEMKDYGLWGICITSFDLSPIVTYGKKYSLKHVNEILRHINYIPEIDPLEWIYRQSIFSDEQIQVCFIKSGIGPTVEDTLFEPYFYLLFADPQSYFGEFPAKLTAAFNNILG